MSILNKKKYHKLSRWLLSGLVAVSLWSCSDSQGSAELNPDEEVPDGMVKLSLMVPDYETGAAQFGSRAFNPKEEGYMSNLYVIAIKYADFKDDGTTVEYSYDKGAVFTYALNPVGIKFEKVKEGQEDYKKFNVALFPGKYKFAVVANLDLYLWRENKISDFRKESDLRNIVLYYSEDTPLTPGHLPMVCMPTEIKYSVDVDNTGNYTAKTTVGTDALVTIEKGKPTAIYADMNFLCSKVRYTILFDKNPGGISEAFGSSWIRFNVDDRYKPIATNIRSWTILDPENSTVLKDSDPEYSIKVPGKYIVSSNSSSINDEDETIDGNTGSTYGATKGWWNMSIDRYFWHETEGSNYPLGPESELTLWNKSLDEWIESKQKVWQGIVYLPENTEEGLKTRLEFPYHTRLNSDEETPEVMADNPKVINLFDNLSEKYEGLTGENYSNETGTYTGLERDYFYDVVAKVVNPGVDMKVKVFVSIIPWHEVDQNLSSDQTGISGSRPADQTNVEGDVEDFEWSGREDELR